MYFILAEVLRLIERFSQIDKSAFVSKGNGVELRPFSFVLYLQQFQVVFNGSCWWGEFLWTFKIRFYMVWVQSNVQPGVELSVQLGVQLGVQSGMQSG